jgi:tetratricopeptide (TPR) repeat protein
MPGLLLGGLAVAMGGLAYLNALDNPFVYDDLLHVVEEPRIRDLRQVPRIVGAHVFRPVVHVSYALDYAVWGLSPVGFHLTSLLLHLTNVGLVFRLVRTATADARPPGEVSAEPRMPVVAAFAAAGLFAVHPLLTEAVGYVSARAEVMCTTFFLLALGALRRALLTGSRGSVAAGVALAGLAFLSKESAIMLPFVLLAYDRMLLGSARPTAGALRRARALHAGLLAAAALLGVVRAVVFLGFEGQPPPVAWWQYLLMEAGVVWRYLGLLVWPVAQSLVHEVPEVSTPLDGGAWAALLGLAALAGSALWIRRRVAPVTLGLTWFLLLLVPSSSVMPLGEAMAEHRVYLASVGFFLAVAAAGAEIAAWLRRRRWLGSSLVPGTVLGSLLVLASLATVSRNLFWADPVRLWQDAATKAPGVWLPHYALAEQLRLRGDCEAAIPRYEEARRLRPAETLVYANLGVCLVAAGRREDAGTVFETARRLRPGDPRPLVNLGVLALEAGDPGRAQRHFLDALARDARHVPARRGLVALYEGPYADPAAALRLCREIRELAPAAAGVDECIRRNVERLGPGAALSAGRP